MKKSEFALEPSEFLLGKLSSILVFIIKKLSIFIKNTKEKAI